MENIFAKSGPEWTTLKDHTLHVSQAAQFFAKYLGMDETIAHHGALLHDMGKAHPVFQKRLKKKENNSKPFRHEIASLLFLSAFPEKEHASLIEMVAGHHKSVKKDSGDKGLLDLENGYDYEDFHLGRWDEWSPWVFTTLKEWNIECEPFSMELAKRNLRSAIEYCQQKTRQRGFSEWRGLLMGADHFASALIYDTEKYLHRSFNKANLSFFNRTHELYPLSFKSTNSDKKHTLVVASTGAGKTDFLFKRTKGRVFYTLPYQASINAMFKRVARDLESTNTNLDIRVLHSASIVVKNKKDEEESALQTLFGSSIKIMTPHQLASIAFGLKGYESLILDLKGCDIILDEIHTYTGVSQAIVIKLVEILKQINCRIHIGTATMPTVLYKKIREVLDENVLEVQLTEKEMDQFDRHTIYKIGNLIEANSIIKNALANREKILIIFNRVSRAQEAYHQLQETYPTIPILLLHSRFKRGDRNEKEKILIGLDENGNDTGQFNTSKEACIVVSTQIVEVSLDISFDVMITETAPIDSLIQRFGRVNRKRSLEKIGQTKNIYVLPPPSNTKDALPYDLEILKRSYEILPHGEVLRERDLQTKIDYVFPTIDFLNIEEHSVFKSGGNITIDLLTHRSKSVLFELLDIDSVSCICEGDQVEYDNSYFENRLALEIPARYWNVRGMNQSQKGNKPFIIPDKAYDKNLGLDIKKISENNFDVNNQLL